MRKHNESEGFVLKEYNKRSWALFTSIDMILILAQLFISMYISETLSQNIIFGGALFIAGQFWITFSNMYSKNTYKYLPLSIRARGALLFFVSLALNIVLLFAYPRFAKESNTFFLILVIFLMISRGIITDYIAVKASKESKTFKMRLILIVVHIAFIALLGGILLATENLKSNYGILAAIIIYGIILLAKQLFLLPLDTSTEENFEKYDDIMEVSSYKIYNKTLINSLMSLNLGITIYVCYLRFLPYDGFIRSFIGLLVWLTYLLLITSIGSYYIFKRTNRKYDKPAIFFFGALIWIATTILIYNGKLTLTGNTLFIAGAMCGLGLSCMLSIIISLGAEMKSVIELALGENDSNIYEHNTRIMVEWSILLSLILTLIMLTISSFVVDGTISEIDGSIEIPDAVRRIMFSLPIACAIAAIIYLELQPLDKQYVQKLREYRAQLSEGELNEAMEKRLKNTLVTGYPKKIGIRILKSIVRPFFPLRIRGKENVEKEEMPVIFICNHYEIYGPVAAILRIPYYLRPWVIYSMLDEDIISDAMEGGVDKIFSFLPPSWRKKICGMADSLVLWIIKSLDPIPVYRENPREVIKTMRLTVEALECKDNILLFPEDPRKEENGSYLTEGVSEFFTGFSKIGKEFYKKTGKRISFIPVYINKSNLTLTFGEGVKYDPANNKTAEKNRITNELYDQMSEMQKPNAKTRKI